jgi:hypothetical protein
MYGVVKLFQGQFSAPSLEALTTPLGELPPMRLLWLFMGYSKPYIFFGGFLETAGGLLLFFRRTALLGALMVAAVMLNVVMLNLCLELIGQLEHDAVVVRVKRLDETQMPLLRERFSWINPRSYE